MMTVSERNAVVFPPAPTTRFTRRGLFSWTTGAALCVALQLPLASRAIAQGQPVPASAFIKIERSGAITFVIPQVEMGQGIYTALAMVLAEELDADWSRVQIEHAPPNAALYGNPLLGEQITGGSSSVRAFFVPLRQAGALVRISLIEAAARQLKVSPAMLRTESSEVIHDASGRRIAYGDLISLVAAPSVEAAPPLKSPKDFRIIGKPLKRLDTPDKTNGAAKYGIDALPPGVKFATLALTPVLGGKVVRVDDRNAVALPGVRQVVVLEDVVAVVGDHMWAAKRGLEALNIEWDDGPNGGVSSALIWDKLRAASHRDGAVARDDGDAARALSDGDVLTREFEMPFLAHACMEPLNCTLDVRQDGTDVWVGTQIIGRARDIVAKVTALPVERVRIHQHLIGGGFGRRLDVDMIGTAARIARQVDGPVKIVWSREEDIRNDYYRPAYHDILSAKVADKRLVAWKHKVSGAAITARFAPGWFKDGLDSDGIDGAKDVAYEVPNVRVEFVREEPPAVMTGWWRGVGPNNNVFAIESFIDEVAHSVAVDPIEFRIAHLGKTPRLRAVLELVREKSDWSAPLPDDCGRGVAAQTAFGSFIATVVECAVNDFGEIALRRVTSCVDAGIVINPDTVIAQLQGGLIYGLTAGLYGEITLENGRVHQSNFNNYRILRINEVPRIDVHLIPSADPPGGIGETGTTASIAALRNAIYDASGVALHRMPVDRSLLAKGARS